MSRGAGDSGSPAGAALAPHVLAELREVGGARLVRELMAVFVERTPERLRSAERALAAGDLAGCAAALHSLRSASGTVGAGRLADLAGRLERAARGGDGGAVAAQLNELRREADEALASASRLITPAS